MEFLTGHPFITALISLAGLAIIFGGLLGYASVKFKTEGNPIVDQINEILPQTQCGQCGYPGCRPYAEALAEGDAINKCPPGGEDGVHKLANLLGVDFVPLDETADDVSDLKKVAYIREDECIGCTKCIQACPVDAILGSAKHMHTVIVSECTGCDLCVDPCPVDCIDMLPIPVSLQTWRWEAPPSAANIIATDATTQQGAA